MIDIKDYTKEIEDLFIQFMVSDPELFVRCKGITDSKYFNSEINKRTIEFLSSHSNDYNALPTIEQIRAVAGKEIEVVSGIADNHKEWFLNSYEKFCRHKALELAILSSPDLLEESRYGEVEAKIKEAVQIGLVKDLGTDYFADPLARLEAIKNNSGLLSTGWRDVDKKLYGGFNRGEITIFAGQPGAGKSLFLQNLAINWAIEGLNVVYITLELSENLCAMRLDAMTAGYETREVLKNSEDVAMRVKSFHKKHKGNVRLKYMPSGSTVNDIRAYVKEYEVQTGIKTDAILVDYLDLCWPVTVKVAPSDQFIKDKYVSEEFRNLAADLDVLFATASQLNRGSFEEIEFDASHIAGGISKVNTADNVIAIFSTMAMKEAGRYQVQFMKTRSSSGVGSKVDLAFNQKTLRISDLDDDDAGAVEATTKNIMDTLKQKSVVKPSNGLPTAPNKEKDTPADTANKATALRNLLKGME
jgi:KaiC/GvpD/RAD55 family RecA-like ATPase